MVPLLLVLIVLAIPGLWLIGTYNRFVRLRQHIRESWSGIDVEMKRRYNLIPNLVNTVKAYARHERETLEQIIALRNKAQANHGDACSQALDESALMIGVKKLFALVENYPQLKSDAHFLALQKELALTEDRIAASRRFYNGNIREMNQLCAAFPTNLVAQMFSFKPGTYFQLDSAAESAVPRIDFTAADPSTG